MVSSPTVISPPGVRLVVPTRKPVGSAVTVWSFKVITCSADLLAVPGLGVASEEGVFEPVLPGAVGDVLLLVSVFDP
jgi:hypothetical protein